MILLSNVDLIMVGVLGASAIAAVSIFTQPRMMLLTVARSLAAAVTLLTAEYFGGGRLLRAGRVLRQSLFLGAIIMLVLHIIFFAYLPQLLLWMGAEQHYLQLALDYAWIALGAVYLTSITAVLQAIQLGFGETSIVLKTNLQGNIINVIVNALLIFGLGPFPAMGVRGAAYATVIARAFEFILFIVVYSRLKPAFMIRMADFFKINGRLFRETLKKGALILFCEMVWVFSETITTAVYNGRGGADVVSGMAAGFSIANLLFVAFGGIYSATGVILGKSLGAGKLEKARTEKTWLLSGAAVFGLFVMLFGFGTTLIVPVVYGRLSASAVKICRDMVMLIAILMPFWLYMNTQQAIARAGGDTAMGFYVDGLLTLFVMIPMVLLLGKYTLIGPVMMYACVKVIDLMKVVIFHFWLKRERWLKNLTKVA